MEQSHYHTFCHTLVSCDDCLIFVVLADPTLIDCFFQCHCSAWEYLQLQNNPIGGYGAEALVQALLNGSSIRCARAPPPSSLCPMLGHRAIAALQGDRCIGR